MKQERIIKISTPNGGKPFIKQLPGLTERWGDYVFAINEDIPECDFWFVYGNLEKEEHVRCRKGGKVLITTEPPSVKSYSKRFTDQFDAVVTCQNINSKKTIRRQQSLPWWVGYHTSNEALVDKTYDQLKEIDVSKKKTKELSIIVSNKIFTKGHRERYHFAKKLQEHFGDSIDVFGIGFEQIDDKWYAIAPYKYHIVIENSQCPDYWTEKLSDAFLGQSYPIYCGCSNINDYFSRESMTRFSIDTPDKAIEEIRNILLKNPYDGAIDSIAESKNLILEKYQIFPALCSYAETLSVTEVKDTAFLSPEETFPIVDFFYKIRRRVLSYF